MASRRKNTSFFYAALCVAMAELFLLSGRVPFLEIYRAHDEDVHHVEPHDHDEKKTHVHTHRHEDGTSHSHIHYHGHCGGKISGDPMNCFHPSTSISPDAVWLFHSAMTTSFVSSKESHISGIFRPPILA